MADLSRPAETRAVRLIASALLSSEFSLRELRGIAQGLRNGSLSERIFVLIEDACFNLDPKAYHQKGDAPDWGLEELLDGIRAKRLSRDAVIKRMSRYPSLNSADLRSHADSMDELLMYFLDEASPSEVDAFARSIESGKSGDPFLRGITKR